MKLEMKYDLDEEYADALSVARAVVDWFLADPWGQEIAMEQRKLLGEVTEHIEVFCKNHPIEDYRGEE